MNFTYSVKVGIIYQHQQSIKHGFGGGGMFWYGERRGKGNIVFVYIPLCFLIVVVIRWWWWPWWWWWWWYLVIQEHSMHGVRVPHVKQTWVRLIYLVLSNKAACATSRTWIYPLGNVDPSRS